MTKHKNDISDQENEMMEGSVTDAPEAKPEGMDCSKCFEYLAGWQRAQADYANLKKDLDRLKQEYTVYANENLLHELLPAIDQFEMALSYLPDTNELPEQDKKKMDSWLVGIKAVRQLWEQTFESIGLKGVDTDGAFDPEKHNAVGKEEDETKPHDSILKVVQPGWQLNGKVLRPAKVIVNQLTKPNNK